MILDEWNKVTAALPPDTPVIFLNIGNRPIEPDDYCDGAAVFPSQMWSSEAGWQPCVVVELVANG